MHPIRNFVDLARRQEKKRRNDSVDVTNFIRKRAYQTRKRLSPTLQLSKEVNPSAAVSYETGLMNGRFDLGTSIARIPSKVRSTFAISVLSLISDFHTDIEIHANCPLIPSSKHLNTVRSRLTI